MERNYSTQMEAARKGIVTPELEAVAKKENRSVEELLPLMASGKTTKDNVLNLTSYSEADSVTKKLN